MKKRKVDITPSVLYHISKGCSDIVKFETCTHFGTYQSAIDRSKSKVVNSFDLYLYEAELNIQNPFKIRDFKDGNHTPLRLVDQLYYTLKAISSDERDKVFDALRRGNISAMNEIVRIFADKGYDGFVYVNKHEDIGSLTWMNFYQNQVKILKVSHIEKDI